MTKKEFFIKVINGKEDLLGNIVQILRKEKIAFCVIGGLAVNAYAEPLVSLDMDIVVIVNGLSRFLSALSKKYKIKKYPNSINISSPLSDLRIQIQTDPRYQAFIFRAVYKDVLGYRLPVARIEDILKGKIWAAQDRARRASKRQKDLADILRLIEAKKEISSLLPVKLKKKLSL